MSSYATATNTAQTVLKTDRKPITIGSQLLSGITSYVVYLTK